MTDPSFYYAIFKRLQAATGSRSVYDDGDHFADDDTLYLAGGFSLRSTDNKYGIFAQLSYNATHYPDYPALQQYWWPLAPPASGAGGESAMGAAQRLAHARAGRRAAAQRDGQHAGWAAGLADHAASPTPSPTDRQVHGTGRSSTAPHRG